MGCHAGGLCDRADTDWLRLPGDEVEIRQKLYSPHLGLGQARGEQRVGCEARFTSMVPPRDRTKPLGYRLRDLPRMCNQVLVTTVEPLGKCTRRIVHRSPLSAALLYRHLGDDRALKMWIDAHGTLRSRDGRQLAPGLRRGVWSNRSTARTRPTVPSWSRSSNWTPRPR